jgi:hypothetical protein
MNDRVGIVAKRHQYPNDSLQMQTRSHATNLGMNAAEGSSTASSSMWVSVGDNGINKPVHLCIGAGIAGTIAKATQCLDTNRAHNGVGVDNKFLF